MKIPGNVTKAIEIVKQFKKGERVFTASLPSKTAKWLVELEYLEEKKGHEVVRKTYDPRLPEKPHAMCYSLGSTIYFYTGKG